jgi:hypothetical protein
MALRMPTAKSTSANMPKRSAARRLHGLLGVHGLPPLEQLQQPPDLPQSEAFIMTPWLPASGVEPQTDHAAARPEHCCGTWHDDQRGAHNLAAPPGS